jgi:hypothetical protein
MSATSDTLAGDVAVSLSSVDEAPPRGTVPVLRLLDPFRPIRANSQLRLSVVIPATDSPPSLERCVAAIRAAGDPPGEIVIVDHPRATRPAVARNAGAALATGDVLVFVDADVEVHPDAFQRIRAILADDGDVTALFGSYDDDPDDRGAVSQFRNLLHHHVHQRSPGTVGTFWAGLGAIRREAFLAAGGFVDHPIEDIELGMRLAEDGASIVLDPRVQGKHLKVWTVSSMVKTDLLVRGAPWIGLALRHRTSSAVLNLGWRHRASAAASVWAFGSVLMRRPRSALAALALFSSLNLSFHRLLLRRTGPGVAAAGFGLHLVHHLTGAVAVPTGILLYIRERHEEAECDSGSSA